MSLQFAVSRANNEGDQGKVPWTETTVLADKWHGGIMAQTGDKASTIDHQTCRSASVESRARESAHRVA